MAKSRIKIALRTQVPPETIYLIHPGQEAPKRNDPERKYEITKRKRFFTETQYSKLCTEVQQKGKYKIEQRLTSSEQ